MIDCVEQQQSLQNSNHFNQTSNQHLHEPHLHLQLTALPQPQQTRSIVNTQQAVHTQQLFGFSRNQQNNQMLSMYHQQLLANNQAPLIEVAPGPVSAVASTTTTANTNNGTQSGNELIGYYFGSISRDTAEWILKNHGNQTDGAYLLRSSGPDDDFVLSLMVVSSNQAGINQQALVNSNKPAQAVHLEVLHYKIVETEDSFVALHGQVGDEKFATIDELIDKAQGVATKPRWPIHRQLLESQILPPTYWGLTVDQIRLAILLKAKQWGFPLLSSLFQQAPQQEQIQNNLLLSMQQQQMSICNQIGNPTGNLTEQSPINNSNNITTLNNETIRTLIYKSLHEFQPWFHGKISREEAERRIEDGSPRDGKFLVRERDNYSYAMCISHKKTTKHYRIDVLPTGELAIQDGRKFTSLMALVSHYTIMSDGLWCALTEACPRPIQASNRVQRNTTASKSTLVGANATKLNRNQFNPTMNQNLYCIPPSTGNNNNNNSNTIMNNMHSMLLSTPTTKSFTETNKNELQQNHGSAKAPQTHNLICTPQQAGMASIKTPIKEWLQTINHKWTQLIASKNQHQSLNSFLFGNQNPLNNHCRHSHRNQHHMSHRRKCRNGHTSCGCIQQMIANGGALNHGTGVANSTNGLPFPSKFRSHDAAKVQSCCAGNLCYVNNGSNNIKAAGLSNGLPKNMILNGNSMPNAADHSNNTLLSCLPQNSGFTLNSQSFIGSPLFAVKQQQQNQTERTHSVNYSGSSNSGSGNSNNVNEEKLISPAQSISANLNNPYDIYGSQTSTAVVNDHLQTSSSSSSGTVNMLHRNQKLKSNNVPAPKHTFGTSKLMNSSIDEERATQQNHHRQGPLQAGPILCGQHAGPAFRYTNCNDENSFRPCYHRPIAPCRAADDSQLTTPSTQLADSTAMAKFVQFQDGQCLRTHRDTKSIQMAYLSSRQAPNNNNAGIDMKLPLGKHQAPLREINAIQQRQNNVCNGSFNSAIANNQLNHCNMAYINNASRPTLQASDMQQTGLSLNSQAYLMNTFSENVPETGCKDIDLMDCGEDDDFNFKYDPKLIKSSSIETLCGANYDEDPVDSELAKCKTNSELMMSLQPCWFANQQQNTTNLLNPVPTSYQCNEPENSCSNQQQPIEIETGNSTGQSDQASLLSTLMNERNQAEQLNHIKKKHDLDELTTALLAELTASLKAQVDLKNKRSGFGLHHTEKQSEQLNQNLQISEQGEAIVSTNPLALVNEFDTLLPNNR